MPDDILVAHKRSPIRNSGSHLGSLDAWGGQFMAGVMVVIMGGNLTKSSAGVQRSSGF